MKIGKNICLLSILGIALISGCNQNSIENFSGSENSYSLKKIYDLPYDVYESSGIIIYDSLLWTFNDSENDPVLYGLDLGNGMIQKVLFLTQAENIDWEDITQDSKSIYIGDFGNNSGTREDLCIYKISKKDIDESSEQELSYEKISFAYEDQNEFSLNYQNTPYDCEALLIDGDSLVLFTKDWSINQSTLYKLPISPGFYKARKSHELNSDGLITGADLNPESKSLLLCGYNNYIPFVIIGHNFQSTNFKELTLNRIDLNDHLGMQLEGISYFSGQIFLSSENSVSIQAFYQLIK